MKLQTIKYCLLMILAFVVFVPAQAQKAKKMLNEANAYFDAYAYEQAIPLYRDVLLLDNSIEAKTKLAEAYRLTNDYEKAEYWYDQIMGQFPPEPEYKLYYGQILQSNGKCEEAIKWFTEYAKFDDWGKTLADGCRKERELKQNKNNYEIWLLPLNSEGSDFGAVYYDKGIVFCSNRDELAEGTSARLSKDRVFLDVYYSERQLGNTYGQPVKLKGGINSQFNDGPISFNYEEDQAFFTRNSIFKGKKMRSQEGALHLSVFSATVNDDGKWSNVDKLSFGGEEEGKSRDYSIAHPSISQDGNNLYFVSDMPGGFGGTDIYQCTLIDTTWSRPVNLGRGVNTPGNEMFPHIHRDGTLYFSSNGHAGMGGLDIYYANKENNKWGKPTNVGYPVNSAKDDFGLTITGDKSSGYFSSNRLGGFGSDDIYYFASSDATAAESTPQQATMAFGQPDFTNLVINNMVGMESVNFKAGDWKLTKKAERELDKLANFLSDTPELQVETGAHTDARGDDFVNLEVSSKRAEAVRQYLMLKGIAPDRVIARGYGESQLTNHCQNGMECSEDLHQENNRLEITVIAISGVLSKNFMNRYANKGRAGTAEIINKPIVAPTSSGIDVSGLTEVDSSTDSAIDMSNTSTTSDLPEEKMTFKVFIGPFKNVDNDTYYTYVELNTGIDLQYTDKGMMVVLGPYDTIEEAEEYAEYAKERGGKKQKIVVFQGGVKTDLNHKKLKKMGVK